MEKHGNIVMYIFVPLWLQGWQISMISMGSMIWDSFLIRCFAFASIILFCFVLFLRV
ncbi:hypothetical protein MtrunA17_Chr8g0352631 [Medicago truncatula]|uniref:Transmembrane protein n=1 Tax=Medicago truncatula TaxID=3880 RepID=A0A396GG70_MEDTR|nr:hypothetical protein MtrunA17_Chr8g0352631 [Medicago truncatula]